MAPLCIYATFYLSIHPFRIFLLFPYVCYLNNSAVKMDVQIFKMLIFSPFTVQPKSRIAAFYRSLGWEYPLEEEMATYYSILEWKIPRPRTAEKLWGCKESDAIEDTRMHTHTYTHTVVLCLIWGETSYCSLNFHAVYNNLEAAPTFSFWPYCLTCRICFPTRD